MAAKNSMIISLDEYGSFEKKESGPAFIAGAIYDGDERRERERIAAYYQRLIRDVCETEQEKGEAAEGFCYPEALHSNGNAVRDREVVKPVKIRVQETLPEFLRSGTYQGAALQDAGGRNFPGRDGTYHLFAILKSDDGKKKLLSQHVNMLANDSFGANLYFHMASTVVNRILFHNPLYQPREMPPVHLDIATRSTGETSSLNPNLVSELKRQGYRENTAGESGGAHYSLMNADIYRTLIAQEMLNGGNCHLRIEKFFVRSIQYSPEKTHMEFLYLADSICSVLGFDLRGASADQWLAQICERAQNLNPDHPNLIFGYDEIDNDFSEAWNCYERGCFFDALSLAYEAKRKKGKFAEYYRERWFPYMEERVRMAVRPASFCRDVEELSALLTTNNLDQGKLSYLLGQYERMIPVAENLFQSPDAWEKILYKLYNAGVTAFCHLGKAAQAKAYYDKCMEYAYYIGIDEILATQRKLVVCLEDLFEWDLAQEIAEKTVYYQQFALELKQEIFGSSKEEQSLAQGKAISQYARILAEKRLPQAEEQFRLALSKLKHGTANYKITQSYLLHFYLDLNLQEEFEKEATDYFDQNVSYKSRIQYLLKKKETPDAVYSSAYAIYVLARGIYLYGKEADRRLICKRLDGEESGALSHPWQIIYKYLELMALEQKDEGMRKRFAAKRAACAKDGGDTILAVAKFGEAQIAQAQQDTGRRDGITRELAAFLQEHFEALRSVSFSEDGAERYRQLGQYFTFMYH